MRWWGGGSVRGGREWLKGLGFIFGIAHFLALRKRVCVPFVYMYICKYRSKQQRNCFTTKEYGLEDMLKKEEY